MQTIDNKQEVTDALGEPSGWTFQDWVEHYRSRKQMARHTPLFSHSSAHRYYSGFANTLDLLPTTDHKTFHIFYEAQRDALISDWFTIGLDFYSAMNNAGLLEFVHAGRSTEDESICGPERT
jgi:hypothetical protein